jgi:hypothetical protein
MANNPFAGTSGGLINNAVTGPVNPATPADPVAPSPAYPTNAAAPAAPTAAATAKPAANVSNWYRSELGRDGDQGGIDYWQKQLNEGANADDVFKNFQTAANQNKELTQGKASYVDANAYSGPKSGNATTNVDEWGKNVLGRELSAEETQKYQGLMNANATVKGTQDAYAQFLKDNQSGVLRNLDWATASQIHDAPTAPIALPSIAKYEAVHSQVDPETGTVQGQINGLLQKGNPLLDRAAALSDQRMNERGLVESSFGVQAGQTAVLDAALQIATPDAAAYNQTRLTNQSYDNDANKTNAGAQNTVQNLAFQNQLQQSNMTLAQQNSLAQLDKQYGLNLSNQLAVLKETSTTQEKQNSYTTAINTVTYLQQQLDKINSDGTTDVAAKKNLAEQAIAAASSQLAYLTSLSGQNYGNLLDHFKVVGGSTGSTGNYTGAGDAPAAQTGP